MFMFILIHFFFIREPECVTSADCDAPEECYVPAWPAGRRGAVCEVCARENAAGQCVEWGT